MAVLKKNPQVDYYSMSKYDGYERPQVSPMEGDADGSPAPRCLSRLRAFRCSTDLQI